MRLALFLTIATGCLLHVYTYAFKAEGDWSMLVVYLFVFSLSPYAVSAILARRWHAVNSAFGFAAGALAGDAFMHFSVFIAPTGSTAALGLLFMPIWNLFLLGPIGAFIAWACGRVASKKEGENAA